MTKYLVLRLHGDDMSLLLGVEVRHALESDIVRLGGTGGEDDLLRVRSYQGSDLQPRRRRQL